MLISILLLGLVAASPALASAQPGTITGTVTTAVRPLRPLRVTTDIKVCGTELPDETISVGSGGALANVVVVLTGLKAPSPYPDPQIVNEKCRFLPRVQLARPGAQARTTSKDPLLHTTNAQQDGGRALFNVGLPIPNMVVARPLNGAGLVRITCNTHQWMRGFVVVTDELAAVTGPDGRFSLAGVPAGTYQLKVWHEMLKATTTTVVVKAGSPTAVAVALTR